MDAITGKKVQEMQMIEQSLQSLLMQKQAFLMESEENDRALHELNNSGDEVYKLVGQLLIKSEKKKILEDLQKKSELLNLRIKNLEKQELSMTDKLENLRQDISKSFQNE